MQPAFASGGASYDARERPAFDRKDSVALLCAILAAAAIVTNALFLQRGPHPAPILVNKVAVPAAKPAAPAARPVPAAAPAANDRTDSVILPRPRPADMETFKPDSVKPDAAKPEPSRSESARPEIARPEIAKPELAKFEPAAKAEPLSPQRPIRVIGAPGAPDANVPRPPDPIGEMIVPPARRVSAVQRVLSDYGYGQIRPTGSVDKETQDAIEQFERAKKLPVTRQITPVLMRELAVLAGRPLE